MTVMLVLGLGVAACSGIDAEALSAEPTTTVTPSTSIPTTTTSKVEQRAVSEAPPTSAQPPTSTVASSAPETSTSLTPTTSPSSQPATSSAPAAALASPAHTPSLPSGYRGALGTYGVDDLLWGREAPLPVGSPGTNPITGLPIQEAGSVVIVKIDNGVRARPQVGLSWADLVIEEEVEGGITRLAAVFHSTHGVVGPVRSGRTTDISFMNSFGPAYYVYSGANDVTNALLTDRPGATLVSAARSNGFWRESGRSAPSNLFTDTSRYQDEGQPPAQFYFGQPSGGVPTSTIDIAYPGTSIHWSWNGSGWQRSQDRAEHRSDGAPITTTNVVVATVAEVATGQSDSAGYPVPEFVLAGHGAVSVFTNGTRIDGTWTRSTLRDPLVLLTTAGEPLSLTPGRTWIQIVSDSSFRSG